MLRRIGVFAGTFDPLHHGHIAFARAAIAQVGLESVFLLPEPMPWRKQKVTPLAQRLAQMERDLSYYEELSVLELPDTRFDTEHTLPKLQAHFANQQLVLLIGSDTAYGLGHWQHIDRLLSSVELVIGLRHKHSRQDMQAHLKALGEVHRLPVRATIIASPNPHMSSTILRGYGAPRATIQA